MKRILFSTGVLAITLTFFSCNKLDQQPISSVPASSFWKTNQDAIAGNAALYAGLQNVFGKTFTEWGDARSDNLTYGGTGENQVNISLNGLDAVTASADWGNLYNTIQRANLAIKYLPNIYKNGQLTQNDFNNYMAQAYTVRAFMYFWAVRLWGNVPVRLTPYETLDSSQYLGRSNKDSIINNVIIPDLNSALTLVNPNLINNFFITQGAILSIQAEVAMWQKRYNDVITITNQITALNLYSLVQDPTLYKNVFSVGTTSENIWTLDWHYLTDGANGLATKLGSNGNTSNYYIDTTTTVNNTNSWYRRWTQNNSDIRRYLCYDTITYGYTTQPKQIWKFYPIDINTGKPLNPTRSQCEAKIPFYRYADILLMQAEAYNATGDTASALTNVRLIRSRAKAGAINSSFYNNLASKNDVMNVILDERQLELYCEGKRWFDLVRNGLVINIMDPLTKARQTTLNLYPSGFSDTAKILWPISRSALTANPSLVQNPSYSR